MQATGQASTQSATPSQMSVTIVCAITVGIYLGNLIREPVHGVASGWLETRLGLFTIATRLQVTLSHLPLGVPTGLFE